jgi:hypothetical protein
MRACMLSFSNYRPSAIGKAYDQGRSFAACHAAAERATRIRSQCLDESGGGDYMQSKFAIMVLE